MKIIMPIVGEKVVTGVVTGPNAHKKEKRLPLESLANFPAFIGVLWRKRCLSYLALIRSIMVYYPY